MKSKSIKKLPVLILCNTEYLKLQHPTVVTPPETASGRNGISHVSCYSLSGVLLLRLAILDFFNWSDATSYLEILWKPIDGFLLYDFSAYKSLLDFYQNVYLKKNDRKELIVIIQDLFLASFKNKFLANLVSEIY